MLNKVLILKYCIVINILFLFIFILSFFIENNKVSNYFSYGWSENFNFVSITINTPLKYLLLCLFIIVLNMSEIFLNDLAAPIIQFSTYNPYKNNICDFTRFELELYSNLIFFIQTSKKFIQVLVSLSQIDVAFISVLSCQISAFIAIRYLLDNKSFKKEGYYESTNLIPNSNYGINKVDSKYESINEMTPLNV